VPEYLGLKIGGSILLIFAILYYIFAAFVLLVIFVGAAAASSRFGAAGLFMPIFPGLFIAITLAMCGSLLHAASAACGALRDIARNSFNPR
jgi:hypothetical protein